MAYIPSSSSPSLPTDFFNEASKDEYKGIDILLTSQLPERGNLVGNAAMRLKPRYHFTSFTAQFKSHVPYMNASNGKLEQIHVTRHINLANVSKEITKDKSKKWIHALGMKTLKENPSDLLKIPKGTTTCPYIQPKRPRWSAERAAEISNHDMNNSSAPQFFFQSHRNNNNNNKRRRQQQRQPERLACWFCLSTPGFETHLVAAIGKHCYVALPKGPLLEGHVLIVPIDHAANSLSTSPKLLQDEIESFLKTMRKYFASIDRDIVAFEHNIYREGVMRHMHVQVVPVPRDRGDTEEAIRESFTKRLKFETITSLSELPERQHYFLLILPSGERMVHITAKDEQPPRPSFGREVLCCEVLKLDRRRVNWKACVTSKAVETEMTNTFKSGFDKFSD
jgi:diadenosine tetraphosphate (Ap4A) HIT family hydrolase